MPETKRDHKDEPQKTQTSFQPNFYTQQSRAARTGTTRSFESRSPGRVLGGWFGNLGWSREPPLRTAWFHAEKLCRGSRVSLMTPAHIIHTSALGAIRCPRFGTRFQKKQRPESPERGMDNVRPFNAGVATPYFKRYRVSSRGLWTVQNVHPRWSRRGRRKYMIG